MTAILTPAPAVPPTDGEAWTALRIELDAWSAAHRIASFWWRDDDAVEPTEQLDRLIELAADQTAPLALAVIPAEATHELADELLLCTGVWILQHGVAHRNHAADGAKKSELGDDRPASKVIGELSRAYLGLDALFGMKVLPVLTPPWNRIAPGVAALLPEYGFVGLSTFGTRRFAVPELVEVNTHIDPVAWRGDRGFVGDAAALAAAVAHLRARRLGDVPDEPTGLLTHHLMMDEATWDFAGRFLAETQAHPATVWLPAPAVFSEPT